MENTSYALQIAGAVMIAVLIIALIVYVFTAMRDYQNAQDDIVSRESITEFNKSFENYNKTLMYGTDVLSCLNLAQSNNQTYVYDLYNTSDNPYITYAQREELVVQVSVILNSTLTEEITVSSKSSSGSLLSLTASECQNGSGNTRGYKISDSKTLFSNSSNTGLFTVSDITYYYFSANTNGSYVVTENTNSYSNLMWSNSDSPNASSEYLITSSYNTSIVAGEYNLVANSLSEATDTAKLIALLSTVTNVKQTVYNDNYSGYGNSNWYTATWVSAAYDFKTRKFECTGIGYDSNTGYVNSISFEEVDNF